jgi:hypothetical protein
VRGSCGDLTPLLVYRASLPPLGGGTPGEAARLGVAEYGSAVWSYVELSRNK